MTTNVGRVRDGFFTPLEWLGLVAPSGAAIRIEDAVDGDRYVIRAEVPGVDPTRDVRITCTPGALRLEVTRNSEAHHEKVRSEFHYGTFVRSVPLPSGADEDTITATYDRGVLEISMQIGDQRTSRHVIPVRTVATEAAPTRRGTARKATRKR